MEQLERCPTYLATHINSRKDTSLGLPLTQHSYDVAAVNDDKRKVETFGMCSKYRNTLLYLERQMTPPRRCRFIDPGYTQL